MTNVSKDFKYCTKCKTEKPVIDFAIANRNKDGVAVYCKSCMNELNRIRRAEFENKKWPVIHVLEGEIWKDIPSYEGLYRISNTGRIVAYAKRLAGERELKIKKVFDYMGTQLYKNGREKGFNLHRLLALTFIPNPENKREVNHKDGNKLNNALDNLEWVTSSENRQHAYDIGLKKQYRGENSWNAKFTNEQVISIRNSSLSRKQLASIYGVSQRLISAIIKKYNYKYVS